MKFTKGLLVLGAVGLLAACPAEEPEGREPMMLAIVCSASLLDSAGAPVLLLQDTLNFEVSDDSVATDPRPCRSSFNRGTRTITLNAKSAVDTATGDPRD